MSSMTKRHTQPPGEVLPYLITAAQLSERIGISADRILRMAGEEEIPSYKMGHRTRLFDTREVLEWLQEYRQGPRVA